MKTRLINLALLVSTLVAQAEKVALIHVTGAISPATAGKSSSTAPYWDAVSDTPISAQESVQVAGLHGLVLNVRPDSRAG